MDYLHQSRQPEVVASNVVVPSAACIAVVLRFYVRRLNKTLLKVDDWMIVLSVGNNR